MTTIDAWEEPPTTTETRPKVDHVEHYADQIIGHLEVLARMPSEFRHALAHLRRDLWELVEMLEEGKAFPGLAAAANRLAERGTDTCYVESPETVLEAAEVFRARVLYVANAKTRAEIEALPETEEEDA